jgi:hypothetical protein
METKQKYSSQTSAARVPGLAMKIDLGLPDVLNSNHRTYLKQQFVTRCDAEFISIYTPYRCTKVRVLYYPTPSYNDLFGSLPLLLAILYIDKEGQSMACIDKQKHTLCDKNSTSVANGPASFALSE